jgi:hypothetical protein
LYLAKLLPWHLSEESRGSCKKHIKENIKWLPAEVSVLKSRKSIAGKQNFYPEGAYISKCPIHYFTY